MLEEKTFEFEKTVEEQALEFERKLGKMADEKTEERTKKNFRGVVRRKKRARKRKETVKN